MDTEKLQMPGMCPPALSYDIWHLITSILWENGEGPDRRDLLPLSSTCKVLRQWIAPRIFRCIRLHNTVKSGAAVRAISQGSMKDYVKELRYMGTVSPANDNDRSLEEVYPPEVNAVLSNLASFPNLERLHISFPYDGHGTWDEIWEDFGNEFIDDAEAVAEAETEFSWRGMMAASYRAIASNYAPDRCPNGTDHLPLSIEIKELPMYAVSTFTSLHWPHFISQLTSFTLSFPRMDNGAGWNLNKHLGYYGFVENLPFWFFDHLRRVEHFEFDPAVSGILGEMGETGIFQASAPKIRSVKFTNHAICAELQDFLVRHMATLERISLYHCHATSTEPATPWAEFLEALFNASPPRLREFELVHEDGESKEEILGFNSHWADKELVEQAKAKIRNEPGAEAFPYVYLSDKYGFRGNMEDDAMTRFLEGGDDRAYKRLMEVVRKNRDLPIL
ncbi:hypothetical protein BJX70DRAFT_374955 [Aspergillus crustosus]